MELIKRRTFLCFTRKLIEKLFMSKKVIAISLVLIFVTALSCSSNKMKYNKSRNGGKRVNSKESMRR